MRRRLVRALAILCIAAVAAVFDPGSAYAATYHDVKIYSGDLPDPGFAHFASGYYVYGTGPNFHYIHSNQTLSGWDTTSHESMTTIPSWVGISPDGTRHLWAPHVFAVDSGTATSYVMYFSGYSAAVHKNCIGVATASSPKGDFVPQSNYLRCPPSGYYELIDPTSYLDAGGNRWIVYKAGTSGNTQTHISAHLMDPSGTQLAADSPVHQLLPEAPNSTSTIIEAPSVVRYAGDGKVYLFVARNEAGTCDYETQVWRADSLISPYTFVRTLDLKQPDGSSLCGPGGAEVINDGGTYRIAWHAWKSSSDGTGNGGRQVWSGVIKWTSNNYPYLG